MPKYTITIDVSPSDQVELEDAMPEIIEMGWPLALRSVAGRGMDVSAKITKVARHAEKERIWKADAE